MKVKKNILFLLAAIVWGIAGFNILSIGICEYIGNVSLLNITISIIVFLIFQIFIFGKLVKKHTIRIKNYEEEKQFFLKFFDVKSFCIMAVMISLGFGLRVSHIVPNSWIAVFYSGLGASLFLAGILFLYVFVKHSFFNKK